MCLRSCLAHTMYIANSRNYGSPEILPEIKNRLKMGIDFQKSSHRTNAATLQHFCIIQRETLQHEKK